MVRGLDGTIYAIIGDLNRDGKLQNYPTGEPDDTSVILRISPNGAYYAMGIRNSFGLAVDPTNGNLWDTENGPGSFDEINFVPENFNSGWETIMGPATPSQIASLPGFGSFAYSDPEFSWEVPVAPTALSFVNSVQFAKYNDSLFVGDCNNGNLYKFKLNPSRTGFVLGTLALSDSAANIGDDASEILLGNGFGCITDIKVGPDGFLYVVSLSHDKIYKITTPICDPPGSGDWIITSSCTMSSSATVTGNIIVQNNAVLAIPNGVTLNVDFATKSLTVKSGSGVLIKVGGKII